MKHRNSLFDPETGIDPFKCIGIDSLHTLSLGVYQSFLAKLVSFLIWICNAWDFRCDGVARLGLRIDALRGDLFAWYTDESAAGRHHTRVQALEATIFGTADRPRCKLHGAETNGFLEFSVSLIRRYEGRLPDHEVWYRAATRLVSIKNMIKEYTTRWAPSAVQVGRSMCCGEIHSCVSSLGDNRPRFFCNSRHSIREISPIPERLSG